jgi:hypothetical protein
MIRRDLERRLRAVELAGCGGFEYWVRQSDGMVLGPDGELLTPREEAEALSHATGILPIFFTKTDLLL